MPPEVPEHVRKIFAAFGSEGGVKRAKKLTKARRRQIALKAAAKSAEVRRANAARREGR